LSCGKDKRIGLANPLHQGKIKMLSGNAEMQTSHPSSVFEIRLVKQPCKGVSQHQANQHICQSTKEKKAQTNVKGGKKKKPNGKRNYDIKSAV
jgi:hypothetical protein